MEAVRTFCSCRLSLHQAMPRYVILFHELPADSDRASHWDLMLEWEGKLRTWALPCEPAQPLDCQAERLADHRPLYLEYEGPIAGDRGRVTRWDEGFYTVERASANENECMIALAGRRLNARVQLTKKGDGSYLWRVSFAAAPTTG
jgi:hypothetical protein